MSSKYRRGDVVRVVKSNYPEGDIIIGHIGTVKSVSQTIQVRFEDDIVVSLWDCDEDELELYTKKGE